MNRKHESSRERDVQQFFNHFVHLRQTGYILEDSWQLVQEEASGLSGGAKRQLAAMMETWEAQFGKTCRPSSKAYTDEPVNSGRPHDTATSTQRPRIKPLPRKQPLAASADADTASPSLIKALLSQQNSAPTLADAGKTRPLDADEEVALGEVAFRQDSILLVYGEKTNTPLRVQITERDEIIIGRIAPDSVMVPDIDLNKLSVNAEGASRIHAAIRRTGQTLIIVDLGSTNNTFVNGQRLLPQEVRVLHDGDELRFGSATLRIHFSHQP